MRYFVYIDNSGKTLFFENEQVGRIRFSGIFDISEEQTHYMRYNGQGLEVDNVLYSGYVMDNVNLLKESLSKSVIDKYNYSIARLKASYPSEEVTGWDIKSLQAKQWLESDGKEELLESHTLPMLENESDGTIDGMTSLATRVLANSNLYQEIYGKNTKKYKQLLVEIAQAETIETLNTIEGSINYD